MCIRDSDNLNNANAAMYAGAPMAPPGFVGDYAAAPTYQNHGYPLAPPHGMDPQLYELLVRMSYHQQNRELQPMEIEEEEEQGPAQLQEGNTLDFLIGMVLGYIFTALLIVAFVCCRFTRKFRYGAFAGMLIKIVIVIYLAPPSRYPTP
eukprot:TRINITY_DN11108_c0_g1_i1.p1 TRINITY_DN11108_c0_g1~~TRINITY_DN11108_c0_g1_i1.p1  ORF type:complete len:149 (+),score=20.87 TRINITY_DN11108_c0_g1_i1:64-510(+)